MNAASTFSDFAVQKETWTAWPSIWRQYSPPDHWQHYWLTWHNILKYSCLHVSVASKYIPTLAFVQINI
jgi:hypothetical protein